MTTLRSLLCSLLLSGLIAAPAHGQAKPPLEDFARVRDEVRALAFDPATYFPSRFIRDGAMIRIAYTGDDYAWPVYSLAVAKGCLDEEPRSKDCLSRLTARMVRAPAPADLQRPRQRGAHMVRELARRQAASPSSMPSHLSALKVEWLEADLRSCPGATSLLARSADLSWVPKEISNPDASDLVSPVLHADMVEVVFERYARRSTWRGYIAGNSPAAWAVELAETLEPCWKPARTAPPWRR
jgi:hypothetical protein